MKTHNPYMNKVRIHWDDGTYQGYEFVNMVNLENGSLFIYQSFPAGTLSHYPNLEPVSKGLPDTRKIKIGLHEIQGFSIYPV